MTDLLLYRLNRVPDRLYVKFLDLIGLRLLPADRRAHRRHVLARRRPPRPLCTVAARHQGRDVPHRDRRSGRVRHHRASCRSCRATLLTPWPPRSPRPATRSTAPTHATARTLRRLRHSARPRRQPPDRALRRRAVATRACCTSAARWKAWVSIPTIPPLVWEAWNGSRWDECEVEHRRDRRPQPRRVASYVHVPARTTSCPCGPSTGRAGCGPGWSRRIEDQPAYSASPLIHGLMAGTVGGTVEAVHAELVEQRDPRRRPRVCRASRSTSQRAPVLVGAGAAGLQVSSDDGWHDWIEVEHFADSGPTDQHYVFDARRAARSASAPWFAPSPTARCASTAPCPPRAATSSCASTPWAAAGEATWSQARDPQTLRSSIPFVAPVENRTSGRRGRRRRDVDAAKERGPILLRTRGRAVTAEDYEHLTREAAPEVARVRCVAAGDGGRGGQRPGAHRARRARSSDGRIRFEDLVPVGETPSSAIRDHLERARVIGDARRSSSRPCTRGSRWWPRLRARPRANAARIREEATRARSSRTSTPSSAGPRARGGRGVVRCSRVRPSPRCSRSRGSTSSRRCASSAPTRSPVSGDSVTAKLNLDPNSLVFSYGHQVRVREA